MGNYCCNGRKLDSNSTGSDQHVDEILSQYSPSSHLKSFSFEELKAATQNFRPVNMLDEGDFGYSYKGWIDEHSSLPTKPETGMVVVVRRFQVYLGGQAELLAKIKYLGRLCHPNLVKLIGYCLEEEPAALVYEFMPRRDLTEHLFKSSNLEPLSWNLRIKVALEAAKALAFLHDAETQVIYRKFQISDILLDLAFNVKLSTVGLVGDDPVDADNYERPDSPRYSSVAPDIAPESKNGGFTAKSDVYCFGVVLLQILAGRRSLDNNQPHGQRNLVEWAKRHLSHKQKMRSVIDTRIEGQYTKVAAEKAADLTLRCLNADPRNRPNMEEVVVALEQLHNQSGQRLVSQLATGFLSH